MTVAGELMIGVSHNIPVSRRCPARPVMLQVLQEINSPTAV
jgi:hypothetical protein